MVAIYVIAAALVGVALDWAIVERSKIILGAFGDRDEVRFRDLPFWRLVLVIAASTAVGVSLTSRELLMLPFWVGTAMFLASTIYGVTLALRR